MIARDGVKQRCRGDRVSHETDPHMVRWTDDGGGDRSGGVVGLADGGAGVEVVPRTCEWAFPRAAVGSRPGDPLRHTATAASARLQG